MDSPIPNEQMEVEVSSEDNKPYGDTSMISALDSDNIILPTLPVMRSTGSMSMPMLAYIDTATSKVIPLPVQSSTTSKPIMSINRQGSEATRLITLQSKRPVTTPAVAPTNVIEGLPQGLSLLTNQHASQSTGPRTVTYVLRGNSLTPLQTGGSGSQQLILTTANQQVNQPKMITLGGGGQLLRTTPTSQTTTGSSKPLQHLFVPISSLNQQPNRNQRINFQITNGQVRQVSKPLRQLGDSRQVLLSHGAGDTLTQEVIEEAGDKNEEMVFDATQNSDNNGGNELERCFKEAINAIFAPEEDTSIIARDMEKEAEDAMSVNMQTDTVDTISMPILESGESQPDSTLKEVDIDDHMMNIEQRACESSALDWQDSIEIVKKTEDMTHLEEMAEAPIDCSDTIIIPDTIDPKAIHEIHSNESDKTMLNINDSNIAPELIKEEILLDDIQGKLIEKSKVSLEEVLVTVEKIKPKPPKARLKSTVTSSKSDDIYCCQGCGCYGLSSEFVNQHFCSNVCITTYAMKKSEIVKKTQDKIKSKGGYKPYPALDGQSIRETMSDVEPEDVDSQKDECPSTKMPWQVGKRGFSWVKYLEYCRGQAAPQKLFKDAFPYAKIGFKVGMKLEGIDPQHQSLYCLFTVAQVQGYRMRLHFDGYPFCYDFWVNADNKDIFPPGWCEKNGYQLVSPRGYPKEDFSWSTYLKQCKATPAPNALFIHRKDGVIPTGFRVGMKLEAVDRKHSNHVCVATVTRMMDSRILVHFDSWDESYDYWVDAASPYIHPSGWCKASGQDLVPPNDYKGEVFSWDEYLKITDSQAAPARAFKLRQPCGFRKNQRVEVVDMRNPQLVRVATIKEVQGHQVKIHFDGWPELYDYYLDDDSADLHPVGWCFKTGHELEAPLTDDDFTDKTKDNSCMVPGCKGVGHIRGPKFPTHTTTINCPYAVANIDIDGICPDRIYGNLDTEETLMRDKKWNLDSNLGTKKPASELKKTVLFLQVSNIKTTSKEIKESLAKSKPGRKRKLPADPNPQVPNKLPKLAPRPPATPAPAAPVAPLAVVKKPTPVIAAIPHTNLEERKLRHEIHESVFYPGYEPNPDKKNKITNWNKYSLTKLSVSSITAEEVSVWDVKEVTKFVAKVTGCEQFNKPFQEEMIDGESLLMMNQNDIVKLLQVKLGPAIKIYNCISALLQKGPSV